jgi:Fe-S cluster biogenesis protein NfuA
MADASGASNPDRGFAQRMQQVEALLEQIERFPDAQARETVRKVICSLMELHESGLAAMLDLVRGDPMSGAGLIETFARNRLVSSLLLLHGLHPVDMETRIRDNLARVRPLLQAQGGDVELLSVADGVVRVRLVGACHGPTAALRTTVEEAVAAAAPEAGVVEIEEAWTAASSRLIPLPLL